MMIKGFLMLFLVALCYREAVGQCDMSKYQGDWKLTNPNIDLWLKVNSANAGEISVSPWAMGSYACVEDYEEEDTDEAHFVLRINFKKDGSEPLYQCLTVKSGALSGSLDAKLTEPVDDFNTDEIGNFCATQTRKGVFTKQT